MAAMVEIRKLDIVVRTELHVLPACIAAISAGTKQVALAQGVIDAIHPFAHALFQAQAQGTAVACDLPPSAAIDWLSWNAISTRIATANYSRPRVSDCQQ